MARFQQSEDSAQVQFCLYCSEESLHKGDQGLLAHDDPFIRVLPRGRSSWDSCQYRAFITKRDYFRLLFELRPFLRSEHDLSGSASTRYHHQNNRCEASADEQVPLNILATHNIFLPAFKA